jgi:hypothetical protein
MKFSIVLVPTNLKVGINFSLFVLIVKVLLTVNEVRRSVTRGTVARPMNGQIS